MSCVMNPLNVLKMSRPELSTPPSPSHHLPPSLVEHEPGPGHVHCESRLKPRRPASVSSPRFSVCRTATTSSTLLAPCVSPALGGMFGSVVHGSTPESPCPPSPSVRSSMPARSWHASTTEVAATKPKAKRRLIPLYRTPCALIEGGSC